VCYGGHCGYTQLLSPARLLRLLTTVANVADVNGDGIPDLVGLNAGHTIQVLLGNGDGREPPPGA
jgi:hypothetical protein